MALGRSFFSGIKDSLVDVWQNPVVAVSEDHLVEDGFVSSEVEDSKISTDTLNADIITNSYRPAEKSDAKSPKLYGNNTTYTEGFEDFNESKVVFAKTATFEDEEKDLSPVFPAMPARPVVAKQEEVRPVRKFAGSVAAVDTSFLFASKEDNAPRAQVASETGHPSVFTNVVPLSDIFNSLQTMETKQESRPVQEPAVSVKADNQVKASVGFNTATASASASTTFSSARFTTGGRAMTNEKVSVQILKPTKVEDVSDACALIKEGNIVMANLCGIPDMNSRLRYLDYLSGCCKGCDAEFKEVVKVDSADCVLVATPKGIGIKAPAVQAPVTEVPETQPAQANEKPSRPSAFSSVFGNVDLGGGQGATTNWYTDKF